MTGGVTDQGRDTTSEHPAATKAWYERIEDSVASAVAEPLAGLPTWERNTDGTFSRLHLGGAAEVVVTVNCGDWGRAGREVYGMVHVNGIFFGTDDMDKAERECAGALLPIYEEVVRRLRDYIAASTGN